MTSKRLIDAGRVLLATLTMLLFTASAAELWADTYPGNPDRAAKQLAGEIEQETNPAIGAAKVRMLDRLAPLLAQDAYLELLETAADEAASPLVAFRLHRKAARVRLNLGNLEDGYGGMEGPLASQGCLRNWSVVGPFDNDSMQGFADRLGPEKGEAGPYDGKMTKVKWRKAPDLDRFCVMHLGKTVEPSTSAVAYLAGEVELDRRREATLLVGAEGAYKIWVNGTLVGRQGENLGLEADNQAWAVDLEKGPNRILVKVASKPDEHLGFVARLVDSDLKPIKSADMRGTWSETPVDEQPESEKLATTGDGLLGRATSCARGSGSDAGWCAWSWKKSASALAATPWRDAAERLVRPILGKKGAEDDEGREKRATIDAADLARLSELFEDHWRRVEAVEKAAKMAPSDRWIQLRLARVYGSSLGEVTRNKRRATLEKLVEGDATFWPAKLRLSDWYDNNGFGYRALDLVRTVEVADKMRRPALLRRLADLESGNGNREVARKLRRKLDGLRKLDGNYAWERISDLTSTGEMAKALKVAREQRKLHPYSRSWGIKEVDLLRASNRDDEALSTLDELIERMPGDGRLRRKKAELLVALERRDDAVAVLEDAVEIRPQNKGLRDLLGFLRPEEKNFHEPWMIEDVRKIAEENPPGSFSHDTVLEQTITHVEPNGQFQKVVQRVERVNSTDGIDSVKTHSASYTKGDEQVDVLDVKVYKKDGTVLEDYDQWRSGSSRKGSSYYNDQGYLNMRANNVEVGDLVEFRYRVRQVANENFRGDYFGDIEYVQGTRPVALSRYVVEAPVTWELYFRAPASEHRKLSNELPGGEAPRKGYKIHGFELKDVPAVQTDSRQPGYADVYDYILVSNKETYDEIGKWWWNLVEEQLIVNDEIRKTVRELTEGLDSKRAKVEALHNYVVRNTRYLHVGLGVHGWKPYRTTQCFKNKYGDCKDKASLLKVMLEEVGIPTNLVLVRTRRLGKVDESPASMHVFNHAIDYIPSLDLFLDPTAEFNGTTELTPMDQGAQALIVKDGGEAELTRLPIDEADDNLLEQKMEVDLSGEEAVTTGQLIAYGQNAVYYRQSLEDPERRDEAFEKQLADVYPGAELVSARYKNLDSLEKPVEIHFKFKGGRLKRENNRRHFIFPYGAPKDLLSKYAEQAERNQDLKIRVPFANETQMRYRLPADRGFERVPEAVDMKSEFGSLRIDYKKEGKSLVADIRYSIDVQRVPAEDYPEFRRFMSKATSALNETIGLTDETTQ